MKQKLVILPALMCDERLFQHQMASLDPLFDISTFIFNSTNNIKEAASQVIDTMGNNNFHLLGASMGGYIAMEVMRSSKNIQSLALINTTFEKDDEQTKSQRIAQIEEAKKIRDNQFSGVNDAIIKKYIHNNSDQITQLIRDMAKDAGRRSFINQQQLILSRQSSVEDFKNYDIPTLVVSSSQDLITPRSTQQKMVNNLKAGILVNIDNCSHLSPLDQPEALSSLLECWYKGLNI